MNSRTSMAQREDRIRKTVYVSDIDQQVCQPATRGLFPSFYCLYIACHVWLRLMKWGFGGTQVTEEQLAALFVTCGQVMALISTDLNLLKMFVYAVTLVLSLLLVCLVLEKC